MSPRARPLSAAAIGLLFMATGAFKLVAQMHPALSPGLSGFAQFLRAAGVPLAAVVAPAVCALELGAGLTLVVTARGRRPGLARIAAATLAVDMLAALATVGIRGLVGHPVLVAGTPLAAEPWRVPLEVVLLALTMWHAAGKVR